MNLNDYRDMPVGSKTPVSHCNPKKESGVVFRNADRITFYCSRCGETKTLRLKRMLSSLCPRLMTTTSKSIIPPDTTYNPLEFPREALEWLSGFDWNFLTDFHKVGYSPCARRVVLPVYDLQDTAHRKPPVAAQLRAVFPDQKPKYMTTLGTADLLFSPHTYSMYSDIILVEDILSAIKIHNESEYVYPVALLGTAIDIVMGHKILESPCLTKPTRIFLWFDSDAAGQKATQHAQIVFTLLGLTPIVIRTEKDPKHCDIRKELNARLNITPSPEVPEGIPSIVRSDSIGLTRPDNSRNT